MPRETCYAFMKTFMKCFNLILIDFIMDLCTKCTRPVKQFHYAIECDKCHKWTHIGCGTGYLKKTYINAVKGMFI